LLCGADVLVHGYRGDALERLGLGAPVRRALRPGLVDVCLNAYGWTGPWVHRRGFDSLVQMSCGIADAAMTSWRKDRPTPLPVQALDHATGYLMAAAAVRGLVERLDTGRGCEARASLARTAQLLLDGPIEDRTADLPPASAHDWSAPVEATPFGPARRLRAPVTTPDAEMHWDHGAVALGSATAAW
jgi:crotonobetainyl-CoA:carnitine CoA-transferase CaiB-like acyl-CoA transferase